MAQTILLALGRLRQEDDDFKESVGYIVRPCFKQNERDVRRKSGRKRKRRRRERIRVIIRIKRLYSFINGHLFSFVRYSIRQSPQNREAPSAANKYTEISKCFVTATYDNDNNSQGTFHFKCLLDTQQYILAPACSVWARQHYDQSEHCT